MFLRSALAFIALLSLVAACVAKSTAKADKPARHLRDADELFDWDECLIGPDEYGPCDTSKFPQCADDEFICYNRRPRQDKFYPDTRQPVFFIDYRNVFCYPSYFSGCSSCTPGRLCVSSQRCILEEQAYECEQWI